MFHKKADSSALLSFSALSKTLDFLHTFTAAEVFTKNASQQCRGGGGNQTNPRLLHLALETLEEETAIRGSICCSTTADGLISLGSFLDLSLSRPDPLPDNTRIGRERPPIHWLPQQLPWPSRDPVHQETHCYPMQVTISPGHWLGDNSKTAIHW